MKIKDILGEEGQVTPGTIEAPPQNGQYKIKVDPSLNPAGEISVNAGDMKMGPDGKPQVTIPAINAGDQVNVVKSDQPTEAGEQDTYQVAPNATDSDLPQAPTMGSDVEPDPKAQQANNSAAADNSGTGMNPDEGYDTDLIRSGHNHPIGGNPTDRYIHQVSDHEIDEGPEPAFGTPEYWAKVQSGEIKLNPAPMPTVPVKPSALSDPGMAAPFTPNPRFKDPGMAAPSDWKSRAKANESADDILLDKMLTIAGLR
jgi:hypothetical protein